MRIGVIHANASAVEPLEQAFRRADPSVQVENFINGEMLKIVDEAGTVTDKALRLFARTVFDAADAGVDGIMIACSVFCTYIDEMRPFVSVPIITVDGPALSVAVERGGKIGILATTAASAPACKVKLEKLAMERGVHLEYEEGITVEALTALQQGDTARHDQLIAEEAARLAANGCGTLILSQITMARAKQAMGDLEAITLTTPDEGVKELLRLV